MLNYIRQRTGSILVKILFALLILSFGAWGIGDMIRVIYVRAIRAVSNHSNSQQMRQQCYFLTFGHI